MNIEYKDIQNFECEELERLFLSVEWSSGHFPDKLAVAIENDFPDEILRATQFAPFAALTGFDEEVEETARLTDSKVELDEYQKAELNDKLLFLNNSEDDEEVSITYFVPDKKKSGGAYVIKKGIVIKVREYEKDVVMYDGTEIPIDDIIAIEGNQFNETESI